MKTIKFSLLTLCGLLAVGGVVLAKDSAKAGKPEPTLQIKVETPPMFNSFHERDVAEALAYRVSETFLRRGYDGHIEEIFYDDEAKADRPVLALNLVRWRRGPTGFVECAFTAQLRRPDGSVQSLGVFSATEIAWNPRTRWELGDAFVGAARGAADQLWHTLNQRDLLSTVSPANAG